MTTGFGSAVSPGSVRGSSDTFTCPSPGAGRSTGTPAGSTPSSSPLQKSRKASSHSMRWSMRANSFCAFGVYTSTNQKPGNSSATIRPSVSK